MDMQDQKAQLNSTEDAHKDSVVTENENETLRKKRADIVIMAGLQISATLSLSFFFTSFGEIAATGAIFTPAFPICCAVFTALFFTFRYLEKK